MLKNENHMIEQIHGLNIHQQRRIAVLFEDHSGTNCGFETVDLVTLQHFPKRAKSASLKFPVVGQGTKIPLHLVGRLERLN